MTIDRSVQWVCMPWQDVNRGSLALSVLTRILADHGIPTSVRYANLDFAALIGEKLYSQIAYMQEIPALLFAPLVNGAAAAGHSLSPEAMSRVSTATGLSGAEVRKLVDVTIPEFVNDLAAEVKEHGAGVLGLSAVMSQLVPAAALAAAVRRSHDCATVVGGAAVFGTMGQAALEVYSGFDIAVLGEAENVIVPLVDALSSGRTVESIPGIASRGPAGVRRSVQTPTFTDLNMLPVPDFSEYVAQYRRLNFSGDPWLSIESSRGCWWGEQSICTFCGLNGETATYRMKSADRTAAELMEIYNATNLTRFCATDNILADGKAGKLLLQHLAKAAVVVPGMELFYQTKSNLSRKKLAEARLAGITTLQPGIESFDTRTLVRMRKGAKGVDQVRCIKLLTEAGIDSIYGILWGSVGDSADEYEAQHRLLPSLTHMAPPVYVTPVLFERFSPYHENPSDHGIQLVPRDIDRELAPPEKISFLPELSETFSIVYEDADGKTAAQAANAVVPRIEATVEAWREHRALCIYSVELDGSSGRLRDTRGGGLVDTPLDQWECRVLSACEVPQRRAALTASLNSEAWPSGTAPDPEELLDQLLSRKLLIDLDERLFTLPIRQIDHRILCLAGPTCAGKTTAVSEGKRAGFEVFDVGVELERAYGEDVARMDPVSKLSAIGDGRSVFLGLREALYEKLRIGRPLIVDSVKSSSDVPVLRELLPGAGILVVGINAPSQLRRERFHIRNRPGDESSMDVKDQRLLSIGVDEVIGNVDLEIVNDGSEEIYRGVLSRVFSLASNCSSLTFWCSGV